MILTIGFSKSFFRIERLGALVIGLRAEEVFLEIYKNLMGSFCWKCLSRVFANTYFLILLLDFEFS